MAIDEINVWNFRNLEEKKIKLSPRLNIFIGSNGFGKTNIIESIYFAIQGESFRAFHTEDLIQHGYSQCRLKLKIEKNNLDYEIETILQNARKNFLLNKKKVTPAYLKTLFPVVLFSPESLAFIKESNEQRRILIDEAAQLIEPKNAFLMAEFRKALKSRNKLLKEYSENSLKNKSHLQTLEGLDQIYIQLCVKVVMARLLVISSLAKEFSTALKMISSDDSVDIVVEYLISGERQQAVDALEIEKKLKKRLLELREKELILGSSLVGPQKHEINFLYNQKDSRFFCSQGQQRSIILAFKMAQIVYHRQVHGEYPVLMLDDVLSELDIEKRHALIRFLHDVKTQIFLTSTDVSLPEFFHLEESSVVELKEQKQGRNVIKKFEEQSV